MPATPAPSHHVRLLPGHAPTCARKQPLHVRERQGVVAGLGVESSDPPVQERLRRPAVRAGPATSRTSRARPLNYFRRSSKKQQKGRPHVGRKFRAITAINGMTDASGFLISSASSSALYSNTTTARLFPFSTPRVIFDVHDCPHTSGASPAQQRRTCSSNPASHTPASKVCGTGRDTPGAVDR